MYQKHPNLVMLYVQCYYHSWITNRHTRVQKHVKYDKMYSNKAEPRFLLICHQASFEYSRLEQAHQYLQRITSVSDARKLVT